MNVSLLCTFSHFPAGYLSWPFGRTPLVLASLLIYSCYCWFCPTLAHVPDTCRLLKFITSHFYLCINQRHQLMALGHRTTRIFFIHCFQVSPLGSGQAIPPTASWCSFDFPSVDHKPPGFRWALWTNVITFRNFLTHLPQLIPRFYGS